MADAAKQLQRMLEENHFTLEREGRHLVYKQKGTNLTFVCASTPSDWRAARNTLTEFKHLLAGTRPGQPVRSSVLERAKADKLMRSHQPPPPKARKGKRSKGIGIRFEEKIVKELSPAEKAESLAASEASKMKHAVARAARIASKVAQRERRYLINDCVEHVMSHCDRRTSNYQEAFDYLLSNLAYIQELIGQAPDVQKLMDELREDNDPRKYHSVDFVFYVVYYLIKDWSTYDPRSIPLDKLGAFTREAIRRHYGLEAELRKALVRYLEVYANKYLDNVGTDIPVTFNSRLVKDAAEVRDDVLHYVALWRRSMAIEKVG